MVNRCDKHRFLLERGIFMKKKFLAFTLLPLLMTSLTGCKEKADINIGVLQFVDASALNLATKGFKAAVKRGVGNKSVSFQVEIANADITASSQIASTFVSKKKDLIMANATPCVSAASNATNSIPVVGTAVSSYAAIFPGGKPNNVTGVSDYPDIKQQVDGMYEWCPTINKLGILYSQAEANSKVQADDIKALIAHDTEHPERASTVVEDLTFADTTDLISALTDRASNYDVIFIPTDNTCADNVDTIRGCLAGKSVKVFAGEKGICEGCALATVSLDYYHIGELTGQMAVDILINKRSPKDMDIVYDTDLQKYYNPTILAQLGMTEDEVPAGYKSVKVK